MTADDSAFPGDPGKIAGTAVETRENRDANHAAGDSSRDIPTERTAKRRRRLKSGLVLGLLLAVVAGFGTRPLLDHLHRRRAADFKAQCEAAAARSDWRSLLAVSHAWQAWDPHSDDGRVYTADAHAQLGDLEQAAETLGQIDDAYHGALQALAIRAELLFSELNRPRDAEATWLRMLRIDPKASAARQRLIYFYAMTLQRKRMLEQIEQSMELGCEPPEAYSYLIMANALNFSDGLAQMTRWRQAYPDDEALEVAQAVYAAKRTADRSMPIFGAQTITPGDQTLLDRCIKKYPSSLETLAVKTDFAIFAGDAARVTELLKQAPPEAEEDSRFWRYRGWLLTDGERYAEAEASFRHALDLHPFEWQSRWMLADVLRKLGKTAEADQEAQLAAIGKELQQKLFERPNARDLDYELMRQIHEYVRRLGAPLVLAALEKRL